MNITFTNIRWRNQDDSDVMNIHAIESIELDGFESGFVTINGTSGKFKAPYDKLRLGGGITHFSFITKHPYAIGEYIEIVIFSEKVAIAYHPSSCVNDGWFKHQCETYVPTF